MKISKTQLDFQDFARRTVNQFTQPPVQPRLQNLPLDLLTWKDFEHLCCRLAEREPGFTSDNVYLYGVQGDNQEGIDIVATRKTGDHSEKWCYQCKKYKQFTPAKLKSAIDKLEYAADHYVICFATDTNAGIRKVTAAYPNITIWDREQISRKLKLHRDLIAEFFHSAWIDAFFGDSTDSPSLPGRHRFRGVIYNPTGQPVDKAHVQILVNGKLFECKETSPSGQFNIEFDEEGASIRVFTTKLDQNWSSLDSFSWSEATEESKGITLEEEVKLKGVIKWIGTDKAIRRAQLNLNAFKGVHVFEGMQRKCSSDESGRFVIAIPATGSHYLRVSAENAIEAGLYVDSKLSSEEISLGLVRNCSFIHREEVVIHRLCDNFTLEMVKIPEGFYSSGLPTSPSQKWVSSFWIARFPITCLQYSVYLQTQSTAMIPEEWDSRFCPVKKEHHPITGISGLEILEFCKWLSNVIGHKHRLPTENEWEKSSRGSDDPYLYPWGSTDQDIAERCNCYLSKVRDTSPVNAYPSGVSLYNIWDLAGNVWEFISETEQTRDFMNGVTESHGTKQISTLSLCGGSYQESPDNTTCCSRTAAPSDKRHLFAGFRVVMVV